MIAVICGALWWLFCYWEKPVKCRLCQSGQNRNFIIVFKEQSWFVLFPVNGKNQIHAGDNRIITGCYTTAAIQIPIVLRHTEIPCLRPAVSSLGACPTPAR
jgi:hypothetical protein